MNVSVPVNPANGKYVATLLFKPTVPFAGCEIMRTVTPALNFTGNVKFTGTPGAADAGTNYFTVRVTDAAGASAFSVVAIYVSVIAANGVWINDGDGLWSTYANWSSSAVGNGIGQTACIVRRRCHLGQGIE